MPQDTNLTTSKVTEADYKYPLNRCNKNGWHKVELAPGKSHELYWEEYGNPQGEPVMFLHGGPGAGCSPKCSRFFDPDRYRIILFDQRGCGKSRPSVSENKKLALANNTTEALVDDIFKLRKHLDIGSRMHVFGGSWGSTLAMAYAIKYAKTVATLILRGIFLGRKQDLDFLYQGNAATFDRLPCQITEPGAYLCFPEAWRDFVEIIPPEKRGDMIKAYNEIFDRIPKNQAEKEEIIKAATAWSVWEGSVSNLIPDQSDPGQFASPEFAVCFASIEAHYFRTGRVFSDENYLINHLHKFAGVPTHIVHGRFDQVCPLMQAEALVAGLKKARAKLRTYKVTTAGHASGDRANYLALTAIMDNLPRMTEF